MDDCVGQTDLSVGIGDIGLDWRDGESYQENR